jgi:hypothetical protein
MTGVALCIPASPRRVHQKDSMRNFLFMILIAGAGLAADLSVSVGIGPSTNSVQIPSGTFSGPSSGATVLFDASKRLFGIGPASIGPDLALAFGGSTNAQLSASSGVVSAYADHVQFALTPGLKARVGLGLLSPWVSFGVGTARLSEAGTSIPSFGAPVTQAGNAWRLAYSPAGGIDIRPLPFIFFRGEIRSYIFKTPEQALAGINPFKGNWRGNLLFLAGVGIRF